MWTKRNSRRSRSPIFCISRLESTPSEEGCSALQTKDQRKFPFFPFFPSKMLKWTMYGPLLGVFLENMKNKARNERPGSAQRKRGVSGQKLSGRDVQGIQLRLGS